MHLRFGNSPIPISTYTVFNAPGFTPVESDVERTNALVWQLKSLEQQGHQISRVVPTTVNGNHDPVTFVIMSDKLYA